MRPPRNPVLDSDIVEENLKNLKNPKRVETYKLLLDCLQETITWNKPSLDSLADAAAQLSCGVAEKNDSKEKDSKKKATLRKMSSG